MGEGAGGTRIRWRTVAPPRSMAMLATVNKWEKLGARYGGWPAHFLSGELSAPLAGIQNVAVYQLDQIYVRRATDT